MHKLLFKNRIQLLLISIILLGLVLRAHNLTTWPRFGATFDEYAWTWLGISLINNQVPSSWSNYEVHMGHRKFKEYQDVKFWIIEPYLEHPPLFGLVAGGFAKLNGVEEMFDLNIYKIRPLALILGVLSIGALFILVKELYDDKTALLASLLFATVPTIVIGSRLVQNENFFIPLYLLSLFLIARFIKSKNIKYLLTVSIICGLLTLAKVPWFAAGLSMGLILLFNKKYKHLLLFSGIVISIFSLFLIYGAYFNLELFVNVWKFQMERYEMTFNSVFSLFTQPFLADRFFIDGWIYFGWIAFILVLLKDIKKNYILIFGFLGYFLIYVFAIPDTPGHGWYRYPFYPFLIISLAIFIKEYFNKNIILTFMFILLVGLSLLENSFKRQFGFSFSFFRLFLIASCFTLLPLFFKSKRVANYSKLFSFFMLIFLFGLNVWSVMEYNEQ